ncbi:DUF4167 domain-containing protein [Acuticoccus kalidii]|uniref:DUF4167 domain-containing protein n=1 Tax=Acuticoccus kalidii TaxID=2910977 RepID=UPI0034E20236
MRPNNPNKRLRGRNRSKNSNPLARSYESNGPDVKIRGSALQVADKYAQLARDAQSAGDRVMAENYFQHAEHYYRIVAQAYEQSNTQQPRERRDDNDRGGRYDDRFRGEQPSVNGYDGIDDDEDDGVRRTVRANGNNNDRNLDDDDGDDDDDNKTVQATVQPSPAHNGNGNGDGDAQSVETASESDEAGATVELNAAEAPAEDDAKPKRRPRTTRPRTRTRRTADADKPATETAESTN